MIAIDRSQGIQSLRYVNEQTSEYVEKRPVIIFPEGTRTAYKDQPDLKPGIFSMYKSLNKPVVPISLNSGYCWPKNNKIKSGEIIIEFKEPIQPGLSKKEFLDQLKNAINSLNH
jgi:1-acyl-sn-glycerol-3-phosphate acyltransferase